MTEKKPAGNVAAPENKGSQDPSDNTSQPISNGAEDKKSNEMQHNGRTQQQHPKARKTWNWIAEKEKEANLADYLIVLLTAAIVFWAGMTWLEVHDAGHQTDKIVAADERMAKAMEDTVTNGIETSRNDQRAWVGINGILIQPLKKREQITIQIPYTNSGRSLALDVRTRSFATTSDTPIRPLDFIAIHKTDPFLQPTVLFPGIPSANMSIVVPPADAAPIAEAIKTGRTHLYVLGEISYRDIFNRLHSTTFCGEYSTKTQANLVSCSEYNTAD
jgi:hypothetical protein